MVCLLRVIFLSLLSLAVVSSSPLLLHLEGNEKRAAAGFPDPTVDSFYKTPANVASYQPGQVIRKRSVVTTITSNVKSSYQLFYRTTNTQGKASATVATVWAPSNPRSPPQVLDYNVYSDTDALDCEASWAFVAGSDSKATGTTSQDTAIFIQWALDNGIYVVVPDDEGLRAAFIAGFEEGRATLDGMRAIRNFYKLPQKTDMAISGYSGGAHVTAWTANLASAYAKDLNIIGAAHGGTPIDTKETFQFLNKGPFAGFAGAGLVGVMNAYPALNDYITKHVNADGTAAIKKYRSNNFCESNVSTSAPFVDFLSYITVSDPFNVPIIKTTLAKETLLMDVSSVGVAVPKFPRYQWHALEDEVVPYAGEQKFVQQQCAKGANIQFQTFPAAEHITAEFLGIPAAIVFLSQAFGHTTPKVLCGTPVPNPVSLADPAVQAILGPNTLASIAKYNNTVVGGKTIKF